jgi:hypothetical protein
MGVVDVPDRIAVAWINVNLEDFVHGIVDKVVRAES